MKAGALRHRITIQRKLLGVDGFGGPSPTWETIASVPASIEPLQGREFISAQAVQSEVTGKIRIRYRPDVVAANRLLFGSKVYNVLSVINTEERNRELVFMVSEGLTDGN